MQYFSMIIVSFLSSSSYPLSFIRPLFPTIPHLSSQTLLLLLCVIFQFLITNTFKVKYFAESLKYKYPIETIAISGKCTL